MKNSIEINAVVFDEVNLAYCQNRQPIISKLTVRNNTEETVSGLKLNIHTIPVELCDPLLQGIPPIAPNKSVEITPKPALNIDYLSRLTEQVNGSMIISVSGIGEPREHTHSISIHPYNYWTGQPELLAAFILRNDPFIKQIISQAAVRLKKDTGNPSFCGYQQDDPNRARLCVKAVIDTVIAEQFTYVQPPCSEIPRGQPIRSPGEISIFKQIACLSGSVFICAALECVGYDTAIAVTSNHAIPCVCLKKSTISETILRDKDILLQDKSWIPIESTLLCAGKNATFENAVSSAQAYLAQKDIEYILDVSSARRQGISPLPLAEPKSIPQADPIPEEPIPAPQQPAVPPSKLVRYEKKLLNLSLKNTLLNMKYSSSGLIPLLTSNLSDYRKLSQKASYTLCSFPWSGSEFETLGCGSAQANLENHHFTAALGFGELETRCKAIYKKYQTCLRDQGVHILYLAVGILRYYETCLSTEVRYAPLELYPLEMTHDQTAGFRLRLLSTEPRLNVTLVEKLKQSNYSLPQPDNSPNGILNTFRALAATQPRWAVLDQACIGQFFYSGCVMFNDIHDNRTVVESHPLVDNLLNGRLITPVEEEDDNVLWFPLVTNLDPSQECSCRSAVHSKTGHVIFGPAGCGKTTVTANIITGLGYLGNTTLFNVEQATAKNVVKDLLDKLGFGDLVLDLYDPKVRTADVLRFLEHILELPREEEFDDFPMPDAKLAKARRELDDFSLAMHRKQPCGLSLYELIHSFDYAADNDSSYKPDELPPAAELTQDQLDAFKQLLEKLSALTQALGCAPCDHPLRKLPDKHDAPGRKERLIGLAENYRTNLEEFQAACAEFTDCFDLVESETHEDYHLRVDLGKLLLAWAKFPAGLTRLPSMDPLFRLCDKVNQAQDLKRKLLCSWKPEFLRLNAADLLENYAQVNRYPGNFARRAAFYTLNESLQPYRRAALSPSHLGRELERLDRFQQLCQEMNAIQADLEPILSESFDKPYCWDQIRCQAEEILRVRSQIEAICGPNFLKDFDITASSELIQTFCDAWDKLANAEEIAAYLPDDNSGESNWIDGLLWACDQFLAKMDGFRDWTAFHAHCVQAESDGFGAAAADLWAGTDPNQVCQRVQNSLHSSLINHLIDTDPALSGFSGPAFRQQSESYRKLQETHLERNRKCIRSRIIRRIQSVLDHAASETDAITFLRRAIRSKGKNLPLRTLVAKLDDLLPRLCLCIIASPSSVAQFLPMKELFSHVIVDEASQVPTPRLLGSIARSSSTVLIGDPNQLPPTSFFQATDASDEPVQDLESVLDDCLALGIPQTHLLWHYRSHSSIVAFPHYKFYGKDLLRFPASDRSSHVHLIQVDGVYDRGGTRQNHAEAQALVDHVIRLSHEQAYQDKSFGIIAMNLPQKNLVESLLETACQDDPELDHWLTSRPEPLFCQNLESAQGSERDIILFSVNFGPDADGTVANTWGPLSQQAGWRRLNVAVTRAREEMFVFSSIKPEQITLTESSTLGVQALKEYLEYASGTPLPQESPGAESRTPVQQWLCNYLTNAGYQCDCNVGSGSLKIDVAVIDPENDDRYLLGILMDGSMHAGASFYNRESAIPNLLVKFGWSIYRLYSADFWDHKNTEADKILKLLTALQLKRAG